MNNLISASRLERYFSITKEALEKAKSHFDPARRKEAADFFDMAERYYQDAEYFLKNKKDGVLAFAALNYAHGWLDAGARLGLFKVNDTRLFAAEPEDI